MAAGDKPDVDALQPEGFTALCKDIGVDPDGPDFVLLSWKVRLLLLLLLSLRNCQ